MRRAFYIVFFVLLAPAWLSAQSETLRPLTPVPIQQVTIEDAFWSPKLKLWQNVTLVDSWNKFERDGAIANFDRVARGETGHHAGPPWYDGLVYEMIRGSADFLAAQPDPALQRRIEGYIDRIAAAADKDPDGYLQTWTLLEGKPNQRWGFNGADDVYVHELYNAGALIEAGVHWYRATGQTKLLNVAVRMANIMSGFMGPPPKANQVPGHPLGEEALVKLYQLFQEQPSLKAKLSAPVNEKDYLDLAQFWIDGRGHFEGRPVKWGIYAQDDVPASQQPAIEGHAVRACLLCAGLAAAGEAANRPDLLESAQRLWNNMTGYKMYLTGALGAGMGIEGFGTNYFLPNESAYGETCAAVAGGFFARNMNLDFADAKYADLLERELFNGAMVGVSLSGTNYFYDYPLIATAKNRRWAWHSCPCCPPMFAKFMGGLPGYIYAQDANALFINQFIGSTARVTLNETKVGIRQTTRYPWDGRVKITLAPEQPVAFDLFIRIPEWCQAATSANDLYYAAGLPQTGAARIKVNGQFVHELDMERGYAKLHRQWKAGDKVEVTFDMPVRQITANLQVEADHGLVALMRGPLVYCFETVDNPKGLAHLVIPPDAKFKVKHKPGLLGGVDILEGKGRIVRDRKGKLVTSPIKVTAVPYYASANRTPGDMRVWMPANADKTLPTTLATQSRPSASHCWREDSPAAMIDGIVPAKSSDTSRPRLSWWDHKGTAEWAQLDFAHPAKVSKVRVYWFADSPDQGGKGGCNVPQSWSLLYKDGKEWKPVTTTDTYGAAPDRFNEVRFMPVKTTALRIQVQLQPGWSGGISEWQVE